MMPGDNNVILYITLLIGTLVAIGCIL